MLSYSKYVFGGMNMKSKVFPNILNHLPLLDEEVFTV